MRRLLDEIEAHLERVRVIEGLARDDARQGPDLRHHEAVLVTAYEQARSQAQTDEARRSLERNYAEYWSRFRTHHFVNELDWELLTDQTIETERRKDTIDEALLLGSGLAHLHPSPSSAIRQTWLGELSRNLAQRVRARSTEYDWQIVSRYCERQGLVSRRAEGPHLRMAGLTWLRLQGVDRLRWLLALEREHAVGDRDPWSLSATALARLRRHAGRSLCAGDIDEDDDITLLDWSSVDRWASLGALRQWEDASQGFDYFGYNLTATGERWLRADLDEHGDPFLNLAQAQLQDDRAAVLTPSRSRDAAELEATTMRHARLVAHEVRNKLLPINYALKKIWQAVEASDLAPTLADPRAKVEDGIGSLYASVETWARMSAPVEDLPADFAVLDAIDEARRALESHEGRFRVATVPGAANPHCHGHQGRFVLALLNLMRNAVQAGGPEVGLSLTVDASDPTQLDLIIDDDGPGVDAAVQDHLFTNGRSTRAEGTGHGLALVREVVGEFGGVIEHEHPVQGGARFRLRIPSSEQDNR